MSNLSIKFFHRIETCSPCVIELVETKATLALVSLIRAAAL